MVVMVPWYTKVSDDWMDVLGIACVLSVTLDKNAGSQLMENKLVVSIQRQKPDRSRR